MTHATKWLSKNPLKNHGVVRKAISDIPIADLNKAGDMPPCNAKEGLAINVMPSL